jgi:superfamily II DNA or RNA helicase
MERECTLLKYLSIKEASCLTTPGKRHKRGATDKMTPNGILTQDPYLNYLASKQRAHKPAGFEVGISDLHPMLFDWQCLVVQWALSLGKAALFEERGLGKTLQQVEWAKQVYSQVKKPVLIVCPLAVAKQTIREAAKIDVPLTYVRSMADVKMADTPFVIINYDMLEELDPRYFGGLVLDESSILKSYTGKTKQFILNKFAPTINYRLFCTATPSPNDVMELGNHAEGLGVMDSNQMLANWFQTATGDVKSGEIVAGKYRLRPYAETDFWRWVTTWAAVVSKPSDLGFSDEGYIRQPLNVRYHLIEVDHSRAWETMDDKGQYNMFLGNKLSATEVWGEKAVTFEDRCKKGIELIEDEPGEYHIVWCDTNDESDYLNKQLSALYPGEIVEVKGSDPLKEKEAKLDAFSTGQARIIVTKSKIAGMGLNWQHCARHKFVSVNFKWEEWYQAVGRTDRFGNERQTIVDMVYTETEDRILRTLERKEKQHQEMHGKVRKIMAEFGLWRTDRKSLNTDLGKEKMRLPRWIA